MAKIEKIEKEKVEVLLNKDTNSIMFVGKKKNVDLKVFNIEYIPNKIIKILYFSKKLNN